MGDRLPHHRGRAKPDLQRRRHLEELLLQRKKLEELQ